MQLAAGRLPLLRRWAVLLLGAGLVAAGVAATIVAGLGVGSWQVFETGIIAQTGASFGVVAVTESVLVLLFAWVWLGQRPGAATALFAFVVGPVVGLLLDWWVTPSTLLGSVAVFVAGATVLGAGVGFYVAAGLGASAQDALFVGLFSRFRIRPAVARFVTDASLVLVGWILGGQVGAGTVLITFGLPVVIEPALRTGAGLAGMPVPGAEVQVTVGSPAP